MAEYNRRVQLTGGATFIISLPHEWTNRNSIKKGNAIQIEDLGNRLVLRKDSSSRDEITRILEIGPNTPKEAVHRALTSYYIAGFDNLIVRSSSYMDEKARSEIKSFSKLVMGVEIFEETAKSMMLQNVLDSSSFPMTKAFRRMALNVETMITDTLRVLEENDIELRKSVISRDDEVDRYHFYMMKEVMKKSAEDHSVIFLLLLSRIMERIADHTVNICLFLEANDEERHDNIDSDIIQYLKSSNDLFMKCVEQYNRKELATLNSLIETRKVIIEGRNEIRARVSGNSNLLSSSIAEEISRIGLYSIDIAEILMDMVLSGVDEAKI